MITDALLTRLQIRVGLLGAGLDADGVALTPASSAVLRAEIEADFALLRRVAPFPEWPTEHWRCS